MILDKDKKIRLRFREKQIGCIDWFIVDQDDNLIATLLTDADLWGYTLMFHLDKTIDPPQISVLPEGIAVVKQLLIERGYDVINC